MSEALRATLRPVALLLATLGLLLAVPVGAQDSLEDVLQDLRESWVVDDIRRGYELVPREGTDVDVDRIEITSRHMTLDGEPVAGDELRRRLGDAARDVLRLAELVPLDDDAVAPPADQERELDRDTDGSDDESRGEDTIWADLEAERLRLEDLEAALDAQAEAIDEAMDAGDEERAAALEAELAELEAKRELLETEWERHQEQQEALEERVERQVEVRTRGAERRDARVSFGSGIRVQERESAREVVVILSSLEVDGEVRGDAVVVGGDADVEGEISGSLTVVGGSISLGPEARVYGDATAIGGSIQKHPDALVHGETTEVAIAPFDFGDDWERSGWGFGPRLPGIFGLVFNTFFMAVVVLGMLALAGGRVRAVGGHTLADPWRAAMTGLATEVAVVPAVGILCVILLVSIVGIPLAILLPPLAAVSLLVAFWIGYAGVALLLGRWLERRFELGPYGTAGAALLGVGLIQGWSVIGKALGFIGGPVGATAALLGFLGFLFKYVVWTTGLGALVLEVRARRAGGTAVAALGTGTWSRGLPPTPPPPPKPAGTGFGITILAGDDARGTEPPTHPYAPADDPELDAILRHGQSDRPSDEELLAALAAEERAAARKADAVRAGRPEPPPPPPPPPVDPAHTVYYVDDAGDAPEADDDDVDGESRSSTPPSSGG